MTDYEEKEEEEEENHLLNAGGRKEGRRVFVSIVLHLKVY
jgi:hypothetical protein